MSNYGADADPNILAAQDLAFTKGFLPQEKSNVMQWTLDDDQVVRKLANRLSSSNVLIKLQE